MIKIENVAVGGWEAAIRGMRNPLNSWARSDSTFAPLHIGDNDLELMRKLAAAGAEHRKYLRFITVSMDVVAPLYWWKEMETNKVGTVSNSCSTMHKIASKEFVLDDFSNEHLMDGGIECIRHICDDLNVCRTQYLRTKDKDWWWQMIQLLPSSYNQRRTLLVNYEVLANIYRQRREHKLDEWRSFCKWIETLPYSEVITGERDAQAPEADGAST